MLHAGKVYVRDVGIKAPVVLSETDGSALGSYAATRAPAFDDSSMVTVTSGVLQSRDLATSVVRWTHQDREYVTAPLIVNGFVVEGDSAGGVHLFDSGSGLEVWQASAGAPIAAPDEQNANGTTGLAEAQGVLAVPAGDRLTIFGPPQVRFTGGPNHGAIVRTAATFSFASDPPDPSLHCQLDQAAAVSCASPYTLTGLPDGPHTFRVNADPGTATAQASFVVDAKAPSVAMPAVPPFSSGWSVHMAWSGSDVRSGLASYDVRYRIAAFYSGFGPYQSPAALQLTHATSFTLQPAPGSTVCVSVRARDRVGNISGWSPDACQAIVVDDHAFWATGAWYRPYGLAGFTGSTYSAASARGASLSLAGVRARRLSVIVTVCPSCGRFSIQLPGAQALIVDTHAVRMARQTFVLPPFVGTLAGTLRLTNLDSGKPVYIDAVGALQG